VEWGLYKRRASVPPPVGPSALAAGLLPCHPHHQLTFALSSACRRAVPPFGPFLSSPNRTAITFKQDKKK
jgi:hypothetical protein